MKNLIETQKQELTKEAKRLFKNGGNFETVYEGLKIYRKINGFSHINNLDAIQYLANPKRNKTNKGGEIPPFINN